MLKFLALLSAVACVADAARMVSGRSITARRDAESVEQTAVAQVDPDVQAILGKLDNLVGLDKVKTRMQELVARAQFDKQRQALGLPSIGATSMHMRFLGNPGTGKTVVARIVGELLLAMGVIAPRPTLQDNEAKIRELYAAEDGSAPPKPEIIFKEVSRADLVAGYKGQTAPKVKQVVESALGGVLFIDEAYSLVRSSKDTFGIEAVDTLIKEIEDKRDQLIVIFAGYEKEMEGFFDANPGFKSRVPFTFHFDDYTCNQLVDIGEVFLWKKQMNLGYLDEPTDMKGNLRYKCQNPTDNVTAEGCGWLREATKFSTGCCEDLESPDCKPSRDNGNGRTVRNTLEASYRQVAIRVLSENNRATLEDFDASENSKGPFHCGPGSKFDAMLKSGLTEAEDADLRCAFALLKGEDLSEIIAPQAAARYELSCASSTDVDASLLRSLSKAQLKEVLALLTSIKDESSRSSRATCSKLSKVFASVSASGLLEMSSESESESEESAEESYEQTYEDSWASNVQPPRACEKCTAIMSELSAGKNPKWTSHKISCKGDSGCLTAVVALRYAEANSTLWLPAKKAWPTVCSTVMCKHEAEQGDGTVDSRCGCSANKREPFNGVSPSGSRARRPVRSTGNSRPTRGSGPRPRPVRRPVSRGPRPRPARPVQPAVRPGTKRRPMLGTIISKAQMDKLQNTQDIRRQSRADAIMAELNDMVGLEKVKAGMTELKSMVEFDSWRKRWLGKESSLLGQSFHMRFLGNPGTGKTVVARMIGRLLVELGVLQEKKGEKEAEQPQPTKGGRRKKGSSYGKGNVTKGAKKKSKEPIFEEVSRADLVAEYVGQTAPKVMAAVDRSLGGVLFIDEAYSLVKNKDDSFGNEAVDTLIKEMEDKRDQVVVILAGYQDEMESFIAANPGFKSRVPFEFQFDDYTCDQLVHIGGLMLKSKSMRLDSDGGAPDALRKAVRFSTGCCAEGVDCESTRENGNGRSVRNILEGSYRFMATRSLQNETTATSIESMSKEAEDRLEAYCRKSLGYYSARCKTQKIIDKGLKQGKLFAPCDSATGRKGMPRPAMWVKACHALTHIYAPDITHVLEEQVYQQLHKLCVPGEGKAEGSAAGAGDLRRLVRIMPSLTEEQTMEVQASASCEEAVALLQSAWDSRSVRKASDPLLQEPADVDEIKGASCEVKEVFDELKGLVGLSGVKKAAAELHALVRFSKLRSSLLLPAVSGQSFHMRFLGNPGTGKTVVARLVGELLIEMGVVQGNPKRKSKRCKKEEDDKPRPKNLKAQDDQGKSDPEEELNFQEVSRADLVAEYVGQTAPKVAALVEKATGGVLFIDEAYSIVKGPKDTFGTEAVDTLIKEMEDKREKVIVILAGYEKEMDDFFSSNPGFKSRVPITFHFDDYLCEELVQIGELRYRSSEISLPRAGGRANFGQLVRFASGCCDSKEDCEVDRANGNGRTVRNIVEASTRLMAARLSMGAAPPTIEAYKTLANEDMQAVALEQAEETLGRGCAQRGFLSELTESLQLGALGPYLEGASPPAKRIAKLMNKITFAEEGFQGLLTQETSTGMIGTCERLVSTFSSSLQAHTENVCGANGPLKKKLPAMLSNSTQGLTPQLTADLREHVGEADALTSLLKGLENQTASTFCPRCLQNCVSARNTIDAVGISMKAGSLIDFVTA